jgi:hypothetical protein
MHVTTRRSTRAHSGGLGRTWCVPWPAGTCGKHRQGRCRHYAPPRSALERVSPMGGSGRRPMMRAPRFAAAAQAGGAGPHVQLHRALPDHGNFLCLITPLCSNLYGDLPPCLPRGLYERAHIIRYFPHRPRVGRGRDPCGDGREHGGVRAGGAVGAAGRRGRGDVEHGQQGAGVQLRGLRVPPARLGAPRPAGGPARGDARPAHRLGGVDPGAEQLELERRPGAHDVERCRAPVIPRYSRQKAEQSRPARR